MLTVMGGVRWRMKPMPDERKDIETLLFIIEKAKTLCFAGQARQAYDVLKDAGPIAEHYTEVLDLTDEHTLPERG